MKEPTWLDRPMLDAIHVDLIREHGGSLGLRDSGLRQKWAYDNQVDLASLAAAYGFGLAKNHGFMDGNKRTAFMAIYVFLFLNRLELEDDEPQAVDIMVGVADGSIAEDQLGAWVREHVVRLKK
jgi:death-on-curing protein